LVASGAGCSELSDNQVDKLIGDNYGFANRFASEPIADTGIGESGLFDRIFIGIYGYGDAGAHFPLIWTGISISSARISWDRTPARDDRQATHYAQRLPEFLTNMGSER
jgi:hypothetical protein